MVHQIHVSPEFYDSCNDDPHDDQPLTETHGEYVALASYDFLIAQARYFAWPHLTDELLTGACVHEDAHNTLTMATALGHLELHIKTILELTPKIPPADKLAQVLRKYLGTVVNSSKYAQETAATMAAYTSLLESYGLGVADQYLGMHRRKKYSGPSPYTTFVDRAINLFRKKHVPHRHWSGHMMFLASLAMNTDIDEITAALPDLSRFEELCARSPMAADLRFMRIFREFEESIGEGGLSAEEKKALEFSYNYISRVASDDLPRLLAEALHHQAVQFGLNDYEKVVLDHVRSNPFGYPGKSNVQTVFYAAQPKRKVTAEDYIFYMDDAACAECDLVEIGLASFYENVTYGGIAINFYVTGPPIKTCFWMLHPCCASKCHSLLDDKTLVVYLTRDIIEGATAVEPIRRLIAGRGVIYIFFGDHKKFVSWMKEHEPHLVYTVAEMKRPPVRFVLLRDREDVHSTYVLPVAPIHCDPIDDVFSKIKHVAMSEFADAKLRIDLDKFFPWYVFAPVTA